jgi:hypothetical protein
MYRNRNLLKAPFNIDRFLIFKLFKDKEEKDEYLKAIIIY